MSAHDLTTLPEWIDREPVEGVLSGDADETYESLLASGHLLRLPRDLSELRAGLRRVLPALLRSGDLYDVQDGADQCAVAAQDVLVRLDEDADAKLPVGSRIAAEYVVALALHRDDLESVRHGFEAAFLRVEIDGIDEDRLALIEGTSARLRQLCETIDVRVEPLLSALLRRARWIEPPQQLSAMLSGGPNPWWLELADPRVRSRWRPARPSLPTLQQHRARVAAATGDAESAEIALEQGGKLSIILPHGAPPEVALLLPEGVTGTPVVLRWLVGGQPRALTLESLSERRYETSPAHAQEATSLAQAEDLIVEVGQRVLRVDGSQQE